MSADCVNYVEHNLKISHSHHDCNCSLISSISYRICMYGYY
jgi:hypothetical protein